MSKPPVTVSQCLLHRDPVGREAEAFLRRYALLAALGGRSDLKGAPKDDQLARELEYQLVNGVDLLSADPNAGFPIPAGVRLERLAYSPWLCEEQLPAGAFRLPTNVDEFVRQFQAVTGIGPDEGELFEAVYRITPTALGEIAMEVRDREEEPWPNFRLLLSREFNLLEKNSATAVLWQPPQNAPHFNRPAIDGFPLLGEMEREACISKDLTQLNREMNRSQLRNLLEHADKI